MTATTRAPIEIAGEYFDRMRARDPSVAEFDFLPFTEAAPRENFLGALSEAGLPDRLR